MALPVVKSEEHRLKGGCFPLLRNPSLLISSSLNHVGGDDGIRTHDPLLAGQVLSQLSYTPIIRVRACRSLKIEQRPKNSLVRHETRVSHSIVSIERR